MQTTLTRAQADMQIVRRTQAARAMSEARELECSFDGPVPAGALAAARRRDAAHEVWLARNPRARYAEDVGRAQEHLDGHLAEIDLIDEALNSAPQDEFGRFRYKNRLGLDTGGSRSVLLNRRAQHESDAKSCALEVARLTLEFAATLAGARAA